MKKIFAQRLTLIALVCFSITVFAGVYVHTQTRTQKGFPGENYVREWGAIDSLTDLGFYKEANGASALIYTKAKQTDNTPQVVKSIIYRLKYKSVLEEDGANKFIAEIDQEINQSQGALRAILYSIKGELLWNYYSTNRYSINSRSVTETKMDDFLTWDADAFMNESRKNYLLSIQDEDELKNIRTELIQDILDTGNTLRSLHPTLYDFLAHRALDHFMNGGASANYFEKFEMDGSVSYSGSESFILLNPTAADSLSPRYASFRIFQKLIAFHLQAGNIDPLIDVELKRLSFVNKYTTTQDTIWHHKIALDALLEKYSASSRATAIQFELAKLYNDAYSKPKNYTYKKEANDLCERILAKNQANYITENANRLQASIKRPTMLLHTTKVLEPNKENLVLVTYKNITKVYFRLLEIPIHEYDRNNVKKQGESFKDWLSNYSALKTWSVDLPADAYFQEHAAELAIPALKSGHYVILANYDNDFSKESKSTVYKSFQVSNLSYWYRMQQDDGAFEAQIITRNEGKPVNDAVVEMYTSGGKILKKLYPDAQGMVYFKAPNMKNIYFRIRTENDVLIPQESVYFRERKSNEIASFNTKYFTDRAIYRPGQRVHFKGIKTRSVGSENSLVIGDTVKIEFRDNNKQLVEELMLVTNEFGSFHGSFDIPAQTASGVFRVKDKHGEQTIRVEEYKRPKFEVDIERPDSAYKIGDSVKVKGNVISFSGFPITQANVKYTVHLSETGLHMSSKPKNSFVCKGTCLSNENGEFEMVFPALALKPIKEEGSLLYQIDAEVTDAVGETRTAYEMIDIGYKTIRLHSYLPEFISQDDIQAWNVHVKNTNGKIQQKPLRIEIERILENKSYAQKIWHKKPDVFVIPQEEYATRFPDEKFDASIAKNANAPVEKIYDQTLIIKNKNEFVPEVLAKAKSGKYRVRFSLLNNLGKVDVSTHEFVLYKKSELLSPVKEIFYHKPIKTTAEPKENAQFYIASDKDIQVLMLVQKQNKVLKRELISIKNQQRIISVPILEEYRGDIEVSFYMMRGGRAYSFYHDVHVPFSNKELELKLETFRDKLLPGNEETWNLTVAPKLGNKMVAELLLSMYDASLDKLAVANWGWNIWNKYNSTSRLKSDVSTNSAKEFNYSYEYVSYVQARYDALNWFGMNRSNLFSSYYSKSNYRKRYKWRRRKRDATCWANNDGSVKKFRTVKCPSFGGDAGDDYSGFISGSGAGYGFSHDLNPDIVQTRRLYKATDKDEKSTVPQESFNEAAIAVRKNLGETAFFFPGIKTDGQGNTVFSFTSPDAITRWKFRAFAHTKYLQTGYLEQDVVTEKPLMVNTFVPRFLRVGDELMFTAKVTNVTGKEMSGNAILELKNAINDKSVESDFNLQHKTLSFVIQSGQTTGLEWKIKVPENIDLLTYTIKAISDNFTDGEENVIPVLSNKIQVTEAIPLVLDNTNRKQFSIPNITTQTTKIRLEFTSNPAWYAIQSLPYLMEYPYECAEQTFSRLYANSIAEHIANSNPQIEAVFNIWKNLQPEALQSKLEQNQALKNIVLQETPWVNEAKTDAERKARLGILFDLKKMRVEKQKAISKLRLMQKPNGAFPWFFGGESDRYITQHIVAGFGKMKKIGVDQGGVFALNALNYLARENKRSYDELLKDSVDLRQDHLTDLDIHYLYARSFYTDLPDVVFAKAMKFYITQAEQFWPSKNEYAQAMLALVFQRMGRKELAQQIMASLKSRAIYDDELGMYWKGMLQGGASWNEAPIETQALLIEAFKEVSNDSASVNKISQWLLKNKQTNGWQTTKATVDASYALLLQGSREWLFTNEIEMAFGEASEIPIALPADKEAGTGYFNLIINKENIRPEMATLLVTQKNSRISWGAVYVQSLQELDKVSSYTNKQLSITKQLFVERMSESGIVLEEIAANTKLTIGDKIISKIVIQCDRPMDYVHIKDLRASALEPENTLSSYKYNNGVGYYESTKDVATHYFVSHIPRGTFVFENTSRITHKGYFVNGMAQIQCMYAPEFGSHSQSGILHIK